MTKGIMRWVDRARNNVLREIAGSTNRASKFSCGLAYEGYKGGYIAALEDVLIALGGTLPNRNGWWEEGVFAEPSNTASS